MRSSLRRRRPLSPAAQVALALGGSVLLNLLLAAGIGLAVQLWPTPPLEGSAPPLRLDFTHEPEPEPELTANSSPPKPTPPPYLRTLDRQKQDKPPEDAFFQSHQDTANASESPPTGDLPLPSQDGRKLPAIEFDTREYVAGDKPSDEAGEGPKPAPAVAQTQPTPPPRAVDPPRPQVNREAPRPTPAPTPVAVATPTPPPPAPTPLPPRPEVNEFAMRGPTPPPPPPDFRTTDPPRPQPVGPPLQLVRPRPLPPAPPVVNPGAPGYRPQTVKTKMEGGLSLRGPSSIAARDTPLGRYQKAVSDAIGSRWYIYIRNNADTVQMGSVKVHFYVDSNGKVRRPEVVSGSAGSSLATVSVTAVIEAELPPIPPELAATLPGNQMEVDYTFSSL